MRIAYVLYPDFTALDLVGPYEIISRWPGADVHFVASSLEPVRADIGLTVVPTDTPATLEGKATTTHWGFRDNIRAFGVEVSEDRVVWAGTHISGAGVAAGIDMALALTERVHGREFAEALQLVIEYDPQPPFDSGSPDKAGPRARRLAWRMLLGDRPVQAVTQMTRQVVGTRIGRARRRLTARHASPASG